MPAVPTPEEPGHYADEAVPPPKKDVQPPEAALLANLYALIGHLTEKVDKIAVNNGQEVQQVTSSLAKTEVNDKLRQAQLDKLHHDIINIREGNTIRDHVCKVKRKETPMGERRSSRKKKERKTQKRSAPTPLVTLSTKYSTVVMNTCTG